jgi:hypothetical protein
MTDGEFLRAFFRGWPSELHFGHYEHVRLAWLVIDRHGPEMAPDIVGDGIRRMAAAEGKAALYNETVTRFWVRLIAHVREAGGPLDTVDEAIALAPLLADKNTVLRHWSRKMLFGPEARERWVEPDLAPLPF